MNIEEQNQNRKQLNELMNNNDNFFISFGELDDSVYSDGAIPKKYKELTGISISILTCCNECVLYHIQGCVKAGGKKHEIIEAIKMGVIGGGSITYPTARYAFSLMKELNII